MGKLIVTEFLTLDGVAQAPGEPDEDREGGFSHGGWQMPLLDDKSGAVMFQQASGMDALLLGTSSPATGPRRPRTSPSPGCSTACPSTWPAARSPIRWPGRTRRW